MCPSAGMPSRETVPCLGRNWNTLKSDVPHAQNSGTLYLASPSPEINLRYEALCLILLGFPTRSLLTVLGAVVELFLKKKKKFICLCWVFLAVWTLVAEMGVGWGGVGASLPCNSWASYCHAFSCAEHRALRHKFISCGTWA